MLAGFVLAMTLARRGTPGALGVLDQVDLRLYYYPMYEAGYARIARGELPLWNPHQLCGIPWLATLQAGLLYPGHLLYLLLPTASGLGASAALHWFLLAAGAAAAVRVIGASRAASLVAGALAVTLGLVPRLAATPNLLEAGAWLAPGCVAVLALVRGGGAAWVAFLSLCVGASLLAGYPQYTVYCVYAWGALAAGELAATRRAGSLRVLGALAGAILLGALLAGAQLLPTFELAGQGVRSLEPISSSRMFLGGDPAEAGVRSFRLALAATGMPLGLGAVAACLLPLALLSRARRQAAVLLAIAGVALLFALGPATPLFRLYLALPGLAAFRLPVRILLVSHVLLAMVVALGFDALLRGGAREAASRMTPARVLGVSGAVLALVFAGIGDLRSAGLAAGTAATPLLHAWARRAWLAPGAVACLLLLEILAGGAGSGRAGDLRESVRVYQRDRPAYADLRRDGARSWIVGAGLSPRFPPKLASLFDLRSIEDYEPFVLRRQAGYFEYFARGDARPAGAPAFSGRILRSFGEFEGAERRVRLLDLAGLRWLAATRQDLERAPLRRFLRRASFRPVPSEDRQLSVYENPNALPRSFVTYRVEPAPEPRELLARLSDPGFDPLERSYVEGELRLAPAPGAPARGSPARIVVDEPESVVIEAELAAPGLVVLSDSYYPGWRASVDGRPAEIHATNRLFRGVAAPAGRHEIRFDYRPASVRLGIAASAAGALGLAALLWIGRSPRQRGDPPA